MSEKIIVNYPANTIAKRHCLRNIIPRCKNENIKPTVEFPCLCFIGKCGDGPEGELYWVTFSGIILASNPRKTWTGPSCTVIIDSIPERVTINVS